MTHPLKIARLVRSLSCSEATCFFIKVILAIYSLYNLWHFQVAGDTEVKAQIRLQFRDITGQKCMAIRSLVASQKVIFVHYSISHV